MPPAPATPDRPHWGRRLLWLVGIWAASVLALGVAASVLKLFMRAAGMST